MAATQIAVRTLVIRTSKLTNMPAARVVVPRVPHPASSLASRRYASGAVAASQTQSSKIVPPHTSATGSPAEDDSKYAAYLGEADSNDGHDAHRDAYGAPPPPLDAKHSAYLGEADSDDGFEAQKDVEGRNLYPVDASQSAFLGEADSDDGFEGRRAAHPEEGDHKLEDVSTSGAHGESGEGDATIEETKR